MSHLNLHYSWAENGQLFCHSLPIVVQVVDHENSTLTLSPYLVPGNSDVIVMSKRRLGNFQVKNKLRKKFCDVWFRLFCAIFFNG